MEEIKKQTRKELEEENRKLREINSILITRIATMRVNFEVMKRNFKVLQDDLKGITEKI